MKTRISITMMLVMFCTLLTLATPVQATRPDPLTISADMYLNGPSSAVGTFNAIGLFTDDGSATEVFFIADSTIHGVKTLVGAGGTITIKFQAELTWTSPTTGIAQGQYVIISGTGAYVKLHGVGETYAELDLGTGHILASYTGIAHFD
jgi:hypothetical protein